MPFAKALLQSQKHELKKVDESQVAQVRFKALFLVSLPGGLK